MSRQNPCPHGVLKGPCKACHAGHVRAWRAAHLLESQAYQRAWTDANRDRVNASTRARQKADPNHAVNARRFRFRSLYGISYAEALAMRAAQNNLCAICHGEMSDVQGSVTQWVVDHYDTPAGPVVRGILHRGCNSALGLMNDHDPQALRNAADYIERHGRAAAKPKAEAAADEPKKQLLLRLVDNE